MAWNINLRLARDTLRTGATGDLSLSGKIPSVTQQYNFRPNAAGILIAGAAPIVSSGTIIRPNTGVMTTGGSTPAVNGVLVYNSNFVTPETILSDGGLWHRNQANSWTNMKVVNGRAQGTNGPADTYDDSYSILSGAFGNDYELEAVLHVDPTLNFGIAHECELLLRMGDDSGHAFGYEGNFSCFGGAQIIKWQGDWPNFFTFLSDDSGSPQGLGHNFANGDVIKATAIGSRLSIYINNALMFSCIDTTFPTGSPAIGAFARPDGDTDNGNGKFCFESLKVTKR